MIAERRAGLQEGATARAGDSLVPRVATIDLALVRVARMGLWGIEWIGAPV